MHKTLTSIFIENALIIYFIKFLVYEWIGGVRKIGTFKNLSRLLGLFQEFCKCYISTRRINWMIIFRGDLIIFEPLINISYLPKIHSMSRTIPRIQNCLFSKPFPLRKSLVLYIPTVLTLLFITNCTPALLLTVRHWRPLRQALVAIKGPSYSTSLSSLNRGVSPRLTRWKWCRAEWFVRSKSQWP